tara:strand:- start:25758 stop:25907 length:150 start_codon:yes stop_codon:yes gene_type:complete
MSHINRHQLSLIKAFTLGRLFKRGIREVTDGSGVCISVEDLRKLLNASK